MPMVARERAAARYRLWWLEFEAALDPAGASSRTPSRGTRQGCFGGANPSPSRVAAALRAKTLDIARLSRVAGEPGRPEHGGGRLSASTARAEQTVHVPGSQWSWDGARARQYIHRLLDGRGKSGTIAHVVSRPPPVVFPHCRRHFDAAGLILVCTTAAL